VREKGYAIIDEELEVGLRSLAVPVARSTGEIIAAVSVSAYSARVRATLECRINPRACITPLRDRALKTATTFRALIEEWGRKNGPTCAVLTKASMV
jgi:DNA-binding IclR family transcriptional regulator